MDQYWQTLRPVRKVGKRRGILTVPVFSAACGPSNYSLGMNNTGQAQGTAPADFDLTTALTIEERQSFIGEKHLFCEPSP